jgi:polar amino acid transport system substrate-binding protein
MCCRGPRKIGKNNQHLKLKRYGYIICFLQNKQGKNLTMIKRITNIILSSLCFLKIAAVAGTKTIRIAHQNNFPPFVYTKNGKSVGLIIDILDAVAAREKLKIIFLSVPFTQVQGTLTDGRADAIVPLAITPDRQKTYDFSSYLVMTDGALFVKSPHATPRNLGVLAGKTIVTPKTGPFVDYIQKTAPNAKLIITKNYQVSFDYIVNNKADAAALNLQVGATIVAASYSGKITVPKKMFTELPLAAAVKKGQHADLLKQLDIGIAALRADGTLQHIYDKWKKHSSI